nr:MAG TPA: hypothetical protein [Caudoviricetes sp.]
MLETGIFLCLFPREFTNFISFAERSFKKSWHIIENID